MAHPRKKRQTQRPGSTQNATAAGITKTNPADRTPKSMVIRMGASDVGSSITQLVKDLRVVMEPHTAIKLKERRSNRLRDYTTMAGPLGVTHLLLFSRSAAGNTNLRVAITPRGPTLSFRVEKYSLCKDIARSQRHPKATGGGVQHLTPPLLVMNNFTASNNTNDTSSIPKHLESLTTSVFQSLFPAISPQRTPLSSIRRVLLLNRESRSPMSSATSSEQPLDASYVLSLRHYAITTKPLVSLSRGLKRLRAADNNAATRKTKSLIAGAEMGKRSKGALPNMSKLDDVADYLLDPSAAGFTSASESEVDTDAEVEVMETSARKVLSKRDKQRQRDAQHPAVVPANIGSPEKTNGAAQRSVVQKRAVRLTELGPRIRLRLVKVEEGICAGKVMWHEFVTRTEREQHDMDEMWETRNAEKAERKRIQRENMQRKIPSKPAGISDETAGDAPDIVDGELEDEDWDEYDGPDDIEMEDEARDVDMHEGNK